LLSPSWSPPSFCGIPPDAGLEDCVVGVGVGDDDGVVAGAEDVEEVVAGAAAAGGPDELDVVAALLEPQPAAIPPASAIAALAVSGPVQRPSLDIAVAVARAAVVVAVVVAPVVLRNRRVVR